MAMGEDLASIELLNEKLSKNEETVGEQHGKATAEQQLIEGIEARFQQKRRIYSRIGARDLLALNPCERLPIYDLPVMAQYGPNQTGNGQAHIFGTAASTIKHILGDADRNDRRESAIVFCGEAGAGKTENLFHALRYFANVEAQRKAQEKVGSKFDVELVNALECVLSAFGCAKTLKNDNSTRHGYAIELHYSGPALMGISIESAVPLELSRLAQQKKGERNFSCFYQLCSGIDAEQREKLGLKCTTNYFYLNQGKCPGLDAKREAEQFAKFCQALQRIGFSEHQRELIFRLLAAILHTGNLFFRAKLEDGEEHAELANAAELRWIAHLLDVDEGQLKRILMLSSQGTRLNVDSALDRRDWFAKCIYSELLRWLLSRISMFLRVPMENDSQLAQGKIILVDMPGYERYNNNGYEEFCVNLVSEYLERFFQQHCFGQFNDEELQNERQELARSQWPSNESVVEMLTKRPTGILPLLDDECKFPKGSDETFLQHCNINHLDKPIYAKARLKGRLEMGIRQHFGVAFYAIDGFLQRNRFLQPAAFYQLLAKSKDPALAAIFSSVAERQREDKWHYVAAECLKGVQRICDKLSGAQLHFVRCVRTNSERIAGKFDASAVAKQFKSLDLLDHCRAVSFAFPHKFTLEQFVGQFKALLPEEVVRGQSEQQIAKDILLAQGVRFEKEFVIGPRHVFLREVLFGQLREMQAFTKNFAASIIQRNIRKFLVRRSYLLKRAAIIRIQAGYRGWKCRKRVAEKRDHLDWLNKYGKGEIGKTKSGQAKFKDNIQKGPKGLSEEAIRDLPEELRQIIKDIPADKKHEFKQCSKFISPPKSNIVKPIVPPITVEQFAAENFKTIILGCRREPIETPFLPKESEDEFANSLEIFKLILRYQFESDDVEFEQLAMLAKYIMQKGISHPALRDEIFAQLLNQNYRCLSELASNRIWTLLLMAVHAFPPSGLLFPVLYNYFHSQPDPLSQMLIGGLLKVSTLPEMAATNRTFAPTLLEQTAFERRLPLMLTLQFADGETMGVEANSWNTTDEIVQMVLRQRGIGDEFGWGLHIDDGTKNTELSASQFPFDAIALMESGKMRMNSVNVNSSAFAFFDSTNSTKTATMQQNTITKMPEALVNPSVERNSSNQQNGNSKSEFYRPHYTPVQHTITQNFYRNPSEQPAGRDAVRFSGYSSSQFAPTSGNGHLTSPSAGGIVRQRFDGSGLLWRRHANPNCMSRITEKDETESTVSTVNRQGKINGDDGINTIGRIRNMQIPGDDQNVDNFLDNVFNQALPPVDYGLEQNSSGEQQKYDKSIVARLAASIKGGEFYQLAPDAQIFQPHQQTAIGRPPFNGANWPRRQNPLFRPSEKEEQPRFGPYYSDQMSPPKRFVYRPGGDIVLDSGSQQIPLNNEQNQQQPYETIDSNYNKPLSPRSSSAVVQQYQPNGEFLGANKFCQKAMNVYEENRNQQRAQNEQIPMGGLRRFVVTQSAMNPPQEQQNKFAQHSTNGKYHEISAPGNNFEEADDGDSRTLQSVSYGQSFQEQEAESEIIGGNDWVPESEATLDALFGSNGAGHQQHQNGRFAVAGENIYSISARPKSNAGSEIGGEHKLINGDKMQQKRKKPALCYASQPFQLVVRKQIFMPEEVLDDALEIDLIFAQIIKDCRQRNQMRIRKYEKESVNQLLRSYNVPPAALNTPAQIGTNIKLELINIVRKWPLYFCRFYPCIEERPNGERVPLLLGIGETGIRLVTVGGSRANGMGLATVPMGEDQQMTIQDHFEFSDIADLLLERSGCALRLITRQHIGILLSGANLAEAKHCIQQYLGIGTKRRQFVIAAAEYSTNEQNVLSFEAGDYIQLLDKPDSEPPKSAGTWLYGRLDGRFGWLPAEYVIDANSQDDHLYSASCNGVSMSESGFSLTAGTYDAANGIGTIPPVLEPLFTNLDPSTLFLPDHMGVEHYSMVEFAVRFFRRPKGASSGGGVKKHKDFYVGDWGWKEVTDRVKFTDKPLAHSLLRLESHEADKVAQQAFLCIMRFMGDEPLKRNQSYTDCVYELLSLCHVYQLIRDEVYCQLLKQITANRSEKCAESGLRGWRLLSIVCAYFPCSETLKPYLVKYLGDVAFDHRRTFNALAKLCMFNLAQTYRYGGRRLILAASEVEAIANGRSVRRQWYNLPGGHRRQICTRSVTVAEEIVQALCLEMNIRGQAEQQEFTLCYLLEKDNTICTLLNDEYILDVCTDLENRGEEFLLILMRSVWLHPLRRDSESYTDALFFQLMPNYLAGLYTTLREDGTATAATLNDVATLGALLLLSDPFQQQNNVDSISPTNLANSFVPKTILQLAGISAEQWAQRIRAKMEELAQSVEIVERWPLFGAAFYVVKRILNGKETSPNGTFSCANSQEQQQSCVLAINKFGIRILANKTHQILGEFALDEIREMEKYSVAEANFLEIRLSSLGAQKHGTGKLTIETELGNEISRLIGHYIFLSGSAKKQ